MTTLAEPIAETYLRVAEIWRFDGQEQRFTQASGYYSTHTAFGEASRLLSFQMGQGLIGRCAQRGLPMLLDAMSSDGDFLRSTPAQREGLTVGLAIPIDDGTGCNSVLALFLASARGLASGGVEIWTQGASSSDLGLASAHHGIAEDFRRVTSLFSFKMGEGLPGRTSQRLAPELLSLPDASGEFLRAVAAETSGFVQAVGFPGLGATGTSIVLLGHRAQPIARQIEIWGRDRDGALQRMTQNTATATAIQFDPVHLLAQAEATRTPVPFSITKPDVLDIPLGGVILPFEPAASGFRACMFLW